MLYMLVMFSLFIMLFSNKYFNNSLVTDGELVDFDGSSEATGESSTLHTRPAATYKALASQRLSVHGSLPQLCEMLSSASQGDPIDK